MGGWTRWALAGLVGCWMIVAGADLSAQERPTLTVGIEAGPSLSKFSGPSIRAPSYIVGGFAGAFVEYRRSDLVSFPIGISWVRKGGEGATLANAPFTITTSYLEIPVLVNLTAPATTAGHLGIYVGLSAGFQLGCDVKGEDGTVACGETEIFDTNPEKMEWAVPFGIEYDRELSNGQLIGVDIRYSYGLTDLFTSGDANLESRTWMFLVSWAFPAIP